MNFNLLLLSFLLLTKLSFGQQKKSLLISTHLNTKTGKAVEKVSVVVDEMGACITVSNVKCFYPTLKGEGMSVSIQASSSNYIPINNLELKSYRLSNQKIDTVRVIMSLKAEREKYALAYFEKETGIIIRKRFEQKEKNFYAQINGLVTKMNDIKDKTAIAYQKLEKNLMDANKSLELVQKDKLNEESIAQRLATTLSMLEGEEIPDYVSQAYSLFRQGNVEGADKALNGNAIIDQILQGKLKKKLAKLLDESGDKQIKMGIAVCLFKAQLKSSLYDFKEAEVWFENAYQADTNDAHTLFEYAYFLAKQNRAKRPAELYERALMIYESLAKDNPQQYFTYVATTLNNLGVFYKVHNLNEKAQNAYEHALQIRESLARDNPQQYLPDVANTLNNLGLFYADNNLKEHAQNAYERALMIRESLAKDNPQEYLPDVANTLNRVGVFYADNKLKEKAQKSYERALQIRESLAKDNPQQYLPYVASTLDNLGNFYSDYKLKEHAQNAYERALMIYESLAKDNPQQYLPEVANTLNNFGVFYQDNKLKEQAQNAFERALMIYESLAKDNPQQYLPKVATILNNLGIVFYQDNNLKEQAQKALERALQIRELLAKDSPKQYLPYVAGTLNNLGVFYHVNNLKKKAQKAYERAFMIRDSLAKKNPQQYLPDVATTLNNLGVFYKDNNLKKKAQKAYERALNIYESLAKANPDQYLPYLAESLGSASWNTLFLKEYKLAEEYARKGLAIAPEQNWIYAKLSLALLLQNRWDEAKPIYQEKQNLIGNNKKPLKESFLNDLIDLEAAGIRHPDFEKVRSLLK